ncbi:alpha/beta fold hydrolase [Halalkalibacter alkaliphilus]|uniref:Alpha/beta hydrolase n=1 Tax=Halalkalibacter alkaliphilus TaxID=2917993 RepID=A0A9X2CU90_9BACI|nr:alpha/beta hydrolase [Halalkalibacter alkaliphilus]MCL7748294.1 alpha/beta hydrolase [Halalkalibacter alkaliphilus]
MEFHYINTNRVTLHTAVAGPSDGPLVILLHGFPEFWYGWKKQITPLVKAGYRIVIPDQRGYNLSDKPHEISQYTLDLLRDDIIGLIKHFKREKASIVGHDWGGAVAWHIASTRPSYVDTLIPINMPHPAVFGKMIFRCPTQLVRSLYILFFQLPLIPEEALCVNEYKLMKNILLCSCQANTFKKEEIRKYQASWSQTGALRAMLHWYRAIRLGSLNMVPNSKVVIPVRMIWGKYDPFLSLNLAKESMKMCTDGRLTLIDDATHWVQHEQHELVNLFLLKYLKS